jgi:2-phospho-L-lactate guanylyltransferase (CobY/MobA/RfbA family)
MRTVSINLELPQSAELSATLVQMCLSERERDPVIKAMLESILEQLRQDYAKRGP